MRSPSALIIMRHSKSDWSEEGLEDFDRPLSRKGAKDARRMGGVLRRLGLTPDIILASPATRTRRTAEIVAERCAYRGEIVWEQSFYGADAEAYLAALRGMGKRIGIPLIVGHNPALEQMVAILTGGRIRLPTGATLLLETRTELHPLERWEDLGPGATTLQWLIAPRVAKALG